MTKSILAAIALTAQPFPAGTAPGLFRVTLIAADGTTVATQDTSEMSVTFPEVAAGTYTVFAARLDIVGQVLGTGATSEPITIEEPTTIAIDVPTSVTVSLA